MTDLRLGCGGTALRRKYRNDTMTSSQSDAGPAQRRDSMRNVKTNGRKHEYPYQRQPIHPNSSKQEIGSSARAPANSKVALQMTRSEKWPSVRRRRRNPSARSRLMRRGATIRVAPFQSVGAKSQVCAPREDRLVSLWWRRRALPAVFRVFRPRSPRTSCGAGAAAGAIMRSRKSYSAGCHCGSVAGSGIDGTSSFSSPTGREAGSRQPTTRCRLWHSSGRKRTLILARRVDEQ
jgi:hypothetical protein